MRKTGWETESALLADWFDVHFRLETWRTAFDGRYVVPLAMLLGLTVSQPALAQPSCESLTSLRLPSTTVTTARLRPETTYSGIDNGHESAPGAVSGMFAIGHKRLTPICPYPAVARYKGSGDVNDAASCSCRSQLQGLPVGAVASVTELPFTNGRFEGTGRWINQQAEGEYTVSYNVSGNGDGATRHAVRRLFMKPDGSPPYEETTTVIVTPTTRNRIRVSIASEKGTVEGVGYCLGDQCHYEAMISSDEQLEFTFTAAASRVDGLASSTNKGNFTIWRETLYAR
ncbi:MAG TPA: hypothetical protein VFO67_15730 [Gemmatimonadales bacterium]|nr:hypothetical protein [Gemmatimonadales bacterium]